MLLRLSLALASFTTAPAFAHSGHGAASGWHWHASDTAGFVLVAVLAGLAVWLARGKK